MDRFNKMAHRKIMSLVKFLLIIATFSKLSKSISFTTDAEPSYYDDNRLGDGNIRVVVPEPFNFANLQRLKTKYELEGLARAFNSKQKPSSLSNNDPSKLSRGHSNNNNNNNQNDDDGFLLDKNGRNDNDQMIFDEIVMESMLNGDVGQNEEEPERDFNADLPYGIQNVRRDLRYFVRNTRSKSPGNSRNNIDQESYQTLCPTKRTKIPLETASFEYRPHYYEEVTCFHSYQSSNPLVTTNVNRVCSATGFSCIQLNRTVYLTRRAKDSDCWESETRSVPAGCECMWPRHKNGDIKEYHEELHKDLNKF